MFHMPMASSAYMTFIKKGGGTISYELYATMHCCIHVHLGVTHEHNQ